MFFVLQKRRGLFLVNSSLLSWQAFLSHPDSYRIASKLRIDFGLINWCFNCHDLQVVDSKACSYWALAQLICWAKAHSLFIIIHGLKAVAIKNLQHQNCFKCFSGFTLTRHPLNLSLTLMR